MLEDTSMEQLFERAYFFITEGRKENALALLDSIQSENEGQKRELAYLRAWCYVLDGLWDQAGQVLFSPGVSNETITDIRTLGQTERRRKAYYILVMGDVAVNLARYEEATRHYALCIKFLDERRMNDVNLRLRALLGLGLANTMTGYYPSALKYYKEALRVCGEDPRNEHLPTIYYGLCDVYRHQAQFEQALDYGKKALQLYTERGNKQLICQVRSILGRVYYQMGDFSAANSCYTESLALAMSVGSETMALNNYAALADLRLEEGKPEEAWRYCELALDHSAKVPRNNYVGMMYIVCGKVAESLAKGAEAQEQTEKAISYYEKAVEKLKITDARSDVLSEAYSRLAQILETTGRQDLALTYWRSAYAARSAPEDTSFS